MTAFFCQDPICGEVRVVVQDVELRNSDYDGDLPCHLIPESLVVSGIKDKIDADVDTLRKRWACSNACACTAVTIAEFEIHHTRNLIREPLWDPSWLTTLAFPVVYGCTLTAELTFTLAFEIRAGICHTTDPAVIAEYAEQLSELLEDLREVGEDLGELTDPDELWKRIGGVSPKALRESPSVEGPRRIRLKREPEHPEAGNQD